jgi:hypothetical protein
MIILRRKLISQRSNKQTKIINKNPSQK